MKTHGKAHPGWLLTGLLLGGAAGFLAGRHWPPAENDGKVEAARVTPAGASPADGAGKGATPAHGLNAARPADKGQRMIPQGASPQQTLRKILANPDSVDRMAVLKEWCRTLPPDQVVAVMKEFKGMMEAQERVGEVEATSLFFQSIEVMTQALFERGPENMLSFFLAEEVEGEEDEEADLRQGLGGEIFKKWAEQEPAAARAMLETRLAAGSNVSQNDIELSRHLVRAWIKTEPEAAMGWLLKQPEGIGNNVISPAFQALSHVDPDKARAIVAAQAHLPGRDEIAAVIAQWWAKTTPDKAMEWAQGLPEKLAGPSVKRAMQSWAEADFPAAKQALEGLRAPLREAALPVLVEHWPKKDWGEAAAFLDQQPAGAGRQEAVGQLVRQWADGDPRAASAWLDKQAAGPERDAGAVALAEEVRGSDPEAAAIWGATLSEPRLREESLRETLSAWYGKSVPEALRWLETAPGLTDVERAALLSKKPGE